MSNAAATLGLGPRSVLIATDFSEASEKPLRHALIIARHFGAKFHLAHVVSSIGYTLAGPPALNLACEAASRDAEKLEQELVDHGWLAGMEHEFLVREGIVWQELETLVREKHADLLVIGTHGRKGLGKLLLGSVAEHLFRHADCLVLTVGPRSFQNSSLENLNAPRTYLFATDFWPGLFARFAVCHLFREPFQSKARPVSCRADNAHPGRVSLVQNDHRPRPTARRCAQHRSYDAPGIAPSEQPANRKT